jgi:hypothetical protein
MVPLVIVSVFSLLIAMLSVAAVPFQCRGCLKCTVSLSTFAILFATVLSLLMLGSSIWITKFCLDVDDNVLSYANSTTASVLPDVYKMVRYYVRGDEVNPALEYSRLAQHYIKETLDSTLVTKPKVHAERVVTLVNQSL